MQLLRGLSVYHVDLDVALVVNANLSVCHVATWADWVDLFPLRLWFGSPRLVKALKA